MRDMIVQQSQFQSPYWHPSMPIQVYPLLHSIPKKDGRKQWLECGLDTVHCLCGIYGYMRHHSAKVCADQLSHYGCLGLVTSYVRTWRFLAVSAVLYITAVYLGILKQISLPPGSLLSYIIRGTAQVSVAHSGTFIAVEVNWSLRTTVLSTARGW